MLRGLLYNVACLFIAPAAWWQMDVTRKTKHNVCRLLVLAQLVLASAALYHRPSLAITFAPMLLVVASLLYLALSLVALCFILHGSKNDEVEDEEEE